MTIGVVGGVGAGKSTVLDLLKSNYGCEIIKTDDVAKAFYVPGNLVFEELKKLLGEDIQKGNGMVDLAAIGKKLYGDESGKLREQVNAIVHPAVWKCVGDMIRDKKGISVVETAIPSDTFAEMCDEIWFVYTREDVRVKRLMETRGYTEKRAHDMIHSQISDDAYKEMASFVVDNSGTRKETTDAVIRHMELKRL